MRNMAINNPDDDDKVPTAPELTDYKAPKNLDQKNEPQDEVRNQDEYSSSDEQNTDDTPASDTNTSEDEEASLPVVTVGGKPNIFKRFLGWFGRHKWLTFMLSILALAGAALAVPTTRYPVAALMLKRNFSVVITDSKTNSAVSGASVSLWGHTVTTDAEGKATVKVKVGKGNIQVTKQYYQSKTQEVFVGIGTKHNSASIAIDATGRQVPVSVVNKITGGPLDGALIKVLDTSAKTDTEGKATIVLPTTATTQNATISLGGYNDAKVKIQVVEGVVASNKFSLTPSGKMYFLSNLDGKIDVVKTNLDGTSRKTVLAGTGNEDPNNTALLASRDWKYLALLAKRDGSKTNNKVYLINTATDQLTVMDEGNADFTLVGWEGHEFVYQVARKNVKYWQPNQQLLKSYNAETGKAITLDQTLGQGTSNSDYAYQYISNVRIVEDRIFYIKQWNAAYGNDDLYNGKKEQFVSINANGSNKRLLKQISLSSSTKFTNTYTSVYKPNELYIDVSNNISTTFYIYKNDVVTQTNSINDAAVEKTYPTYLISPSDRQSFWAESRDGKNTLFVGNENGANGKQIASLSEYKAYGWFTDNYLLVSKDDSELYIMPVAGGKPVKISDYYKVVRAYNGYGYGYGGL